MSEHAAAFSSFPTSPGIDSIGFITTPSLKKHHRQILLPEREATGDQRGLCGVWNGRINRRAFPQNAYKIDAHEPINSPRSRCCGATNAAIASGPLAYVRIDATI